jgi:ssRNA-specific RNase YbeY (16S rRNA maturation enzyme)
VSSSLKRRKENKMAAIGSPDPVSSAIQAGTAIANTIASINDINKRRNFEESLSLLSNQQQKELNDKLLQSNSETDRLSILSNSLVQYAIANDANTAHTDIWIYLIAGLLALGMLGAAIYFSTKKKSS